jgi:hypothetical protein
MSAASEARSEAQPSEVEQWPRCGLLPEAASSEERG